MRVREGWRRVLGGNTRGTRSFAASICWQNYQLELPAEEARLFPGSYEKTSVSQGIPGLERKIYKIQGISDFAGDVWQVILLLSQLSEALFGNYRQKWG